MLQHVLTGLPNINSKEPIQRSRLYNLWYIFIIDRVERALVTCSQFNNTIGDFTINLQIFNYK